ncbi:polyketide synthase dehydratase domain-containing protein [Micromonospora sp. M12]
MTGLYDDLAGRGYGYGPAFRGLEAAWRSGDDLYAEVELPVEAETFGIHPALLDAALHAMHLRAGEREAEVLVPFAWTGVTVGVARATAVRVRLSPVGAHAYSVSAVDPAGRLVLRAESLSVRPLSASPRPSPTTASGCAGGRSPPGSARQTGRRTWSTSNPAGTCSPHSPACWRGCRASWPTRSRPAVDWPWSPAAR